jgi:G3E family GTPase
MSHARSIAPGAAPGCRMPVVLLTGFLGSGKTTLLNQLLSQPAFAGTGVIVNELGDTDFNDVTLSRSRTEVIAANAGCFCCQSQSALVPSLQEVERRAGGADGLCRIIVETSGLAAPTPLLQAMMGEPDLVSRYRIAGVITVIDAVTGLLSLTESAEAREQAVFADLIFISKTDVSEAQDIADVRERVRSLNPRCEIIELGSGAVQASGLLHQLDLAMAVDGRPANLGAALGGHHSPDKIRAFTIKRSRPASRAGLALWMDLISVYLGTQILRMKGVLDVDGEPTLVESVRHVFHPPTKVVRLSHTGDSAVVVIARDLQRDQIERAFEALDFESLPRPLDPQAFGRFKDIVARLRTP